MKEIDPVIWFTEREVTSHTPRHFVKSNTAITTESKSWILNNLKGRFAIVHTDMFQDDSFDIVVASLYGYPAFEDPKEAVLFELTWG